ncbi:unnamed protein product [Caenorhabditis angaria]|uniref:Uncharacterized protein n=1 Tax=Caenorhabditis angaria TaxID=860376 RepID=A0A9P1J144_9PELO|nr:unnamed protein product [Caenorhabditis angaria]
MLKIPNSPNLNLFECRFDLSPKAFCSFEWQYDLDIDFGMETGIKMECDWEREHEKIKRKFGLNSNEDYIYISKYELLFEYER